MDDREEDKNISYKLLDCINQDSLYIASFDKYSVSNMTNYELYKSS